VHEVWHFKCIPNCSCFVIVLFCYWKYGKASVQLSPIWLSNCPCLVIVLFCYWKYGKTTVQLSPIWLSDCSLAKQNNNKTRTVWESYWRQLNGCFTVFSIAKQNNNKTRTVWVSYWRQLNGCFTVFSIAKQDNNKTRTVWETVQLSPIWLSSCPCLVIVLFCYWKYGKATVQLPPIWLRLLYRISNSKTKQ
jgi:hypothetical protein